MEELCFQTSINLSVLLNSFFFTLRLPEADMLLPYS
jgi:hypothetical protein